IIYKFKFILVFNSKNTNITATTALTFCYISLFNRKSRIYYIINLGWHTLELICNFTTFYFYHLLFIRMKYLFYILFNNIVNTHYFTLPPVAFLPYHLCYIYFLLYVYFDLI